MTHDRFSHNIHIIKGHGGCVGLAVIRYFTLETWSNSERSSTSNPEWMPCSIVNLATLLGIDTSFPCHGTKEGLFQIDFSTLWWKKFHHVNYDCTLYPYMVPLGWCSHTHVIYAFIHQFLFANQFVHCLSATRLIRCSATSRRWKNVLSDLNEQALFRKRVVAVHDVYVCSCVMYVCFQGWCNMLWWNFVLCHLYMFKDGVCYDTQPYYLFYLMVLSYLYCHLYCAEGHVETPLLIPSYTVHIRLMCRMNRFFWTDHFIQFCKETT
jgi:hypothetical protein